MARSALESARRHVEMYEEYQRKFREKFESGEEVYGPMADNMQGLIDEWKATVRKLEIGYEV